MCVLAPVSEAVLGGHMQEGCASTHAGVSLQVDVSCCAGMGTVGLQHKFTLPAMPSCMS